MNNSNTSLARGLRRGACILTAVLLAAFIASATAPQGQPVTVHVNNFPSTWVDENGEADMNSDSVSSDGRQVLIDSMSHPQGYPALKDQVYVRDMQTGEFETISVNDLGEPADIGAASFSMSSSGRYATFSSGATNLGIVWSPPLTHSQLWIRDRLANTTRCITLNAAGEPGNKSASLNRFSPDEKYLVFHSEASNLVPGDTNNTGDVFVYEVATHTFERVSLAPGGIEANGGSGMGGITEGGRYVAFNSMASNLVPGVGNGYPQAFVIDRQTGVIEVVSKNSQGEVASTGISGLMHISGDGRMVAFPSQAPNMFPGINQRQNIYTVDRVTGILRCMTLSPQGLPGDDDSFGPVLSTDGRYMSFISVADNLIPGFTPPSYNVYRGEILTGKIECVSVSVTGGYQNHQSLNSCINADGRFVVFWSHANNLDPTRGELYGPEVYIRDMALASVPKVYCLSTEGTAGCLPSMSFTGTPSASAPSGFTLTTSSLRNQKPGLLFYATTGSQLSLIPAGWLCVLPPLTRTSVQSSGGSSSSTTDCSGMLQLDFNTWASSGVDPALVAGQSVWAQSWSREPDLPATSYLSDAIVFTLGP